MWIWHWLYFSDTEPHMAELIYHSPLIFCFMWVFLNFYPHFCLSLPVMWPILRCNLYMWDTGTEVQSDHSHIEVELPFHLPAELTKWQWGQKIQWYSDYLLICSTYVTWHYLSKAGQTVSVNSVNASRQRHIEHNNIMVPLHENISNASYGSLIELYRYFFYYHLPFQKNIRS